MRRWSAMAAEEAEGVRDAVRDLDKAGKRRERESGEKGKGVSPCIVA